MVRKLEGDVTILWDQLEGSGEVMGAQQGKVVMDGKDFDVLMEMIQGTELGIVSGLLMRRWRPNGSCIDRVSSGPGI